jgi:hypothetical protein
MAHLPARVVALVLGLLGLAAAVLASPVAAVLASPVVWTGALAGGSGIVTLRSDDSYSVGVAGEEWLASAPTLLHIDGQWWTTAPASSRKAVSTGAPSCPVLQASRKLGCGRDVQPRAVAGGGGGSLPPAFLCPSKRDVCTAV